MRRGNEARFPPSTTFVVDEVEARCELTAAEVRSGEQPLSCCDVTIWSRAAKSVRMQPPVIRGWHAAKWFRQTPAKATRCRISPKADGDAPVSSSLATYYRTHILSYHLVVLLQGIIPFPGHRSISQTPNSLHHNISRHGSVNDICAGQSFTLHCLVEVKSLQLLVRIFEVLLRLHPHVEDRTVLARADNLAVHAAHRTDTASKSDRIAPRDRHLVQGLLVQLTDTWSIIGADGPPALFLAGQEALLQPMQVSSFLRKLHQPPAEGAATELRGCDRPSAEIWPWSRRGWARRYDRGGLAS